MSHHLPATTRATRRVHLRTTGTIVPPALIGLAVAVVSALVTGAAVAAGAPVAAPSERFDCDPNVFDPGTLPVVCGLVPFAPVELGDDAITVAGPERDGLGALALEAGPAGTLEFAGALPDLSDGATLRSVTDEELWPCPPSVDDDAARFLPVRLSARDDRSELLLANQPPTAALTPGTLSVVFVFSDAHVHVRASCPVQPEAVEVDFGLVPGWNAIASTVVEHAGSFAFLLRPLTEDDLTLLEWHWHHLTIAPDEPGVRPGGPLPPERGRP